MIRTSIEKLAGEIGFDIGCSDDIVQSDLINGLSKGLCQSMQADVLQNQMAYIVDKLTPQSERVIEELYEFIKLKK